MAINRDYRDLFKILNENKVRYLIVGAYALIYYTEPRYTKDLDIWIEPAIENAKRTWDALAKFGAPLKDITIEDFTNPDIFYQIGIEPNRVDVITNIEGLAFPTSWKHRTKTKYGGISINIISLSDLIKSKEKANRPQDKIDLKIIRKLKQP